MSELKRICLYNNLIGNEKGVAEFNASMTENQLKLIQEEFKEVVDIVDEYVRGNGNVKFLVKECADLLVVASGMIHMLGFDPEEVLKIINNNNFTKFIETQEQAIVEEKYWGESSVDISITGQSPFMSIISNKDQKDNKGKFYSSGKQLKPSTYVPISPAKDL